MKTKLFLSFISLVTLFACTSVEETTQQPEKKQPEVYVFDDVSKIDSSKAALPSLETKLSKVEPTTAAVKKYAVQLGAFTSKERAEIFVKENQSKTSLPLNITFNGQTQLFVVQIPSYNTKQDADLIRDNLRKFPPFKEAFTVPVEK